MKPAFCTFVLLILAATSSSLEIPSFLTQKLLSDKDPRNSIGTELSSESIDNSIDPDTYLVGGGDAFQIAIVGLPSHEYVSTVNSDGNIYIADVGAIDVGKIPLSEATRKIRDSFRASLKDRYDVYVVLKQAKRPIVTVTGAVSGSGTFRMEGTHRLLDAIKLANQGRMPETEEVNLRNIECRNGDSTRYYDLLAYLAGGERSQNPYVYPGDRIVVRGIDFSIYVGGAVTGPIRGRLPILAGETAENILSILTLKGSADSGYFIHSQAGRPARKVPREDAASVALGDNDVLTIPTRQDVGRQDTVLISGEVVRPGTYPIVWGKTTAAELIEFAGGHTADASAERGFVIRANKIISAGASYLQPKAAAHQIALRTSLATTQVVRPEINSSLNDLVANSDYALIRLADFKSGSVPLEGGDEIHIPRKEDFVYVSGYVKNPGAYPFTEGKNMGHYIGLAKGYSPKADKPNQMVMTYYKGITQFRDGQHVDEGDVIIVPASIENKRLSTVYLPIFQTLATIVSLAITIVAINRTN